MEKLTIFDLFEKDLEKLKDKLEDLSYAKALYAALCNMKWVNDKIEGEVHITWRSSGSVVAELRDKGEDYIDFYCSGNEGIVRKDILEDLNKLGWKPKEWEKEY
jgi:hypothetical protein